MTDRDPLLPTGAEAIASPSLDLSYTYTRSPFALLWSDIILALSLILYLPGTILPLTPYGSGSLDELYPSPANLWVIVVHIFLVVFQLAFIFLMLVGAFILPGALTIVSVLGFLLVNYVTCTIFLNGRKRALKSNIDMSPFRKHDDEKWIFVNGVNVGHHWLQTEVNRLAMTFGREVLGVHNPTYGFIFDLIQSVIERDFLYNTQDTRDGYVLLKQALDDMQYDKVVLILHSQGSIEGGLMIDTLLAAMPDAKMRRLEVYTFACAANHFNNPLLSPDSAHPLVRQQAKDAGERTIRHIEHYANTGDFVSQLGVLKFFHAPANPNNPYVGLLFKREGKGHLLNQHYLDTMFTLDPSTGRVADTNDFMEMLVDPGDLVSQQAMVTEALETQHGNGERDSDRRPVVLDGEGSLKPVKELSRLWAYRNGSSPDEPLSPEINTLPSSLV